MKRFFKYFTLLTLFVAMFASLSVAACAIDPDPVDMSLIFSPETQLTVYVNDEWDAALSGSYGYSESVSLTAPATAGDKTFSHWKANGSVVSYANPLKLTMNANTTLFAVYADAAPEVKPVAGFTSITRSTDGEQIVLQAVASGETAGIVYSTTANTADALKIGGDGVTNVAAVKLTDDITAIPQSALDRNNCYTLKIKPESDDTVYHVRTYVTDGGETTYGDVKDVKLSELPDGVLLIANLEGFEPGISEELSKLTEGMHTVTYDANGGVGATIIQGFLGDSVTLRANTFTREGYTFNGWSTDPNGGGTTYTDGQSVTLTADTTLYARWTRSSSGEDETVTIPVSGEDETVNVTVEIKDDTATIKEADIDKVLEAEEVGTVTIDVSALKENVNEVVIPSALLEKVADAVADEENTADGLEVKLPNGSVTFDADAVAAITEQADGKALTLHLDDVKVTELASAQQEAVSELEIEVVLDAYLTSGGKRISDFNGGSATVSVPYTLKEGQTAQGIVVWYVAADGARTRLPASYDGENVVFTVPHFSNYVIAYDADAVSTCPRGDVCPISAFDDADPTAWYHDGVHFVLANGLMNGTGNGKFAPNGNTSRAMIVTILYRLEGKPDVSGKENPFEDVADGTWYTDAVIWAAENKIVEGYGNGRFDPTGDITREQLAAILYRYEQSKGGGFVDAWMFLLDYPDASEISSWADEAMHWCVMNGIINGKDGKLVPGGDASRAEAATMLMRYCTKITEAE